MIKIRVRVRVRVWGRVRVRVGLGLVRTFRTWATYLVRSTSMVWNDDDSFTHSRKKVWERLGLGFRVRVTVRVGLWLRFF